MKVEDDETTGQIVRRRSNPPRTPHTSEEEDDDDDGPTKVGANAYEAMARSAFDERTSDVESTTDQSTMLGPPSTQPAPTAPPTLQAPPPPPPPPRPPPTSRRFEAAAPSPAPPVPRAFAATVPLVRTDDAAQPQPFFPPPAPAAAGPAPAPAPSPPEHDRAPPPARAPEPPAQGLQNAPFAAESMAPGAPGSLSSLRVEIMIGVTSFLVVAVPALLYIMLH